ncbi:MAG: ABC transporter ATP-binding protein [Legionella sp.]|nr:ABC transporter ATP-binding protein [Legionella sp.]
MYALEIRQLCKTYPNQVEALKSIDLSVKQGDFFALLGANGAGKSTTIGLITTLLTKTSGSIRICGYDLETDPISAKSCLGIVPQEYNLNIFENSQQVLLNQAGYYGISRSIAKPRAMRLLEQLGLKDKDKIPVRRLSGGMKRRLMIARALMHEPKVLILDEPTAGIDIELRRSLWDFLTATNAAGTTIILTTHYLEEAEQLCKNVAIIDKGCIIKSSSMKALLKTLHHQTFILNTENTLEEIPSLEPFHASLIDANTIELRVDNAYTLNDVFKCLDKHGLRVHGLRNKTNRLEELFLDLIKNDH